jgi:hypothetical protein
VDDDAHASCDSDILIRVPVLPLVFTAATARRAGFSDAQIRHRRANGHWITLRRGIYCEREAWRKCSHDPHFAHLVAVAAATLAVHRDSWACHSTARRIHRLPRLDSDPPLDRADDGAFVQLAVLPDRVVKGGRKHQGVDLMPAAVPLEHRDVHRGVPVLTVARTVVDTARLHDFASGLITADAALRLSLVQEAELTSAARACGGWPGIVSARRVVQFSSGRRESPLESRSFAFFVEHDIPLPECQVDVVDAGGRLLGRADFYWRALRLVGEADGKVKYVEGLDGPPLEERLWRERLRHDRLEDAGESVVRWTHGDLTQRPRATRERILRAMRRAAERIRP